MCKTSRTYAKSEDQELLLISFHATSQGQCLILSKFEGQLPPLPTLFPGHCVCLTVVLHVSSPDAGGHSSPDARVLAPQRPGASLGAAAEKVPGQAGGRRQVGQHQGRSVVAGDCRGAICAVRSALVAPPWQLW